MTKKLEFIETIEDIEKNLRYLIACRNSSDPKDVKFYENRMKMGANFVVMVIDGQVEFGPSQFLGYKGTNRSDYEPKSRPDFIGGETGKNISALLGYMQENNLLEEFFYKFLNKHISGGHEPDRILPFLFFLNESALEELDEFIPGIRAGGIQWKVTFNFKRIIEKFRELLSAQENILKDFEINEKVHDDWVWISDSSRTIGDIHAHYEIRNMHKDLWVVLHFEGSQNQNDLFHQNIEILPKGLKWTKWWNSKSICVKPTVSKSSDELVQQLVNQLLFLEESVGNKVREVLKNGGKEMKNVTDNTSDKKDSMNKEPLNQILYGPPGTGKTYHLKNELFSKYVTKETFISSKKHFENTVAELHWWEVISLALKESGKSKVSEILENRWIVEKANQSESKDVRATIWSQLQHYTVDECRYVKYNKRNSIQVFNKTEDSFWELVPSQVEEQIPDLFKTIDEVDNFKADPDKEIKRYVFTTFHQSYAYEDFIEGIKPIIRAEGEEGEISYTIESGVFKRLCDTARKDPENRYAIFIDEINRGNVSSIFGELITLIEPDKRAGEKNALSVKLPYSKNEFSVPSNVDIYGTMNTADRSVEALDTALRRRFSFKEMMPDSDLIKQELGDKNEWNGIQISEVLKTINKRIQVLVDRDHTIGHSYFLGLKESEKFEEDLKAVFTDKIIPLLQEYFFNDYVKIGMVLGKGFIKSYSNRGIKFAEIENSVGSDYEDGNGYEIIPSTDIKLKEAIDQLMLRSE